MKKNIFIPFLLLLLIVSYDTFSQQPKYTRKHFVKNDDPRTFTRIRPAKDGPFRTYLRSSVTFWDIDDRNTTFIQGNADALLCIEGQMKNGKREGVFTTYLIDSLDHKKRYKLYEQQYAGDKINGEWRTYFLQGTLAGIENRKNDTLNGLSRRYWIDGKRIMEERVYSDGGKKCVHREFSSDGQLQSETSLVNQVPNGPAKKFYPGGIVKDEVTMVNGIPNGNRKYYYPSGKLWIESIVKDGETWTVLGNYTADGKKRNAGTLKNGNGTLILYNDDNSIRETIIYKNGQPVN